MTGEPHGLGGRLPARGQGEQRDAERRRVPGGRDAREPVRGHTSIVLTR